LRSPCSVRVGRPAGSLGDGDDHGGLRHARQGYPFLHQGEAAAGGGRHGPYPGIRRPQDHVDGRDLIFGLLEMDGKPRSGRRDVVHDGGGGGHRIPGHELAAAQDGAECQGLIAVELAMRAGQRRNGNGPGQIPFPGKLETLLQIPRFPGFGGLRQSLGRYADDGQNDPDQDGVARGGGSERCFCRLPDLRGHLPGEIDPSFAEVRLVPSLRLRIQGDDHVPFSPAECMDGMIGDADHMKVVPAPDTGHVVLGGEKMVIEP
jgi:hypothetical protein